MKKINKYDSKWLQTIRCICDSIYYCNSETDEANKKQAGLLKHNLELNSKTKPKKDNRRKKQYSWVWKLSLWRLRISSSCF